MFYAKQKGGEWAAFAQVLYRLDRKRFSDSWDFFSLHTFYSFFGTLKYVWVVLVGEMKILMDFFLFVCRRDAF